MGGVKRGIIIRGQVFSCTSDRAGLSAGVQHNLSSQVGGALPLTLRDEQDGRWGDIFVPRESRVRVRVRIWGY